MHAHACCDTHAWVSMVSVEDLTQDNKPVLDSTTNQKELTRQVKMAGAERSEKQELQLSQLVDNFELVVAVEVVDRRARPRLS